MKTMGMVCRLGLVVAAGFTTVAAAQPQLNLEDAVLFAQENDPWLRGSEYRQEATESQSVAAGQLPDPTLSVGFANLPVKDFDFDQEPMTQFKVGIAQVFPRGDSRELKQRQLAELSAQHPYMRADRRAKIAVTVSHLWLELFRQREIIRLIEDDRALFEHLVDVAESSYSSALGKTRQQDLIRAQLELTRLEDRLAALRERAEISRSQLGEWMTGATGTVAEFDPFDFNLGTTLPALVPIYPEWAANDQPVDPARLFARLISHPAILGIEQKITASAIGTELKKQLYKPQWGINASYGYRDDDPVGNDRDDFVSLAVTFDMPLFTSKRQDKKVQAAIADTEAIKTEKVLMLRAMRAGFETARARLQGLSRRQVLYRTRLLEEIRQQAEASLTAYTHDDGDFAEVVRARIAELNARIDALNIDIDRLKTIAQLNYLFVKNGPSANASEPGANQ